MLLRVGRLSHAAILVTVLSQTAQPPLRIGDVARELTPNDLAEIERLTVAAGARPWLLNGPRAQIVGRRYIEVYLTPTTTTREVRRGSVVSVADEAPAGRIGGRPASSQGRAWYMTRTEAYAQVVVGGRDFDTIGGDQDINRPFRTLGEFADGELISLVGFIRSSPSGPMPMPGREPSIAVVRGDWPILSVSGSVRFPTLRLRKSDSEFQIVQLQSGPGGWVILAIHTVFRSP